VYTKNMDERFEGAGEEDLWACMILYVMDKALVNV
jgi:hypothetical protein